MSAWGKGNTIVAALATPLTPEQEKDNKDKEAKRKAEEASKAIRVAATALALKIEAAIKANVAGYSSAYPGDSQYSVKGDWTTAIASMAFQFWKANMNQAAPGSDVALNMHMLGPTLKTTGGRNWEQFNFIRRKSPSVTGRHNVHADAE